MNKFILLGCAATLLAACSQNTKESLGLANTAPDEFSVVTRAPLSVPPDYTLRPPSPGSQRPMEISTQDEARQTVFGVKDVNRRGVASSNEGANDGFLSKVGAGQADPNIRAVVDQESVAGAEDDRSTAEKMMFWSDKDPKDQGTPIDPKEEMKRLEAEGVTTVKKRNEDIEAP